MPTYTAPGHASVYTGTTPSVHGIVGNDWFNKATGKEVYCTEDATVSTLGDDSVNEGKMSPRNLQSSTITDELKLSTNFKGKVIGISIKDRGAILPAGHFADWAFWYSKTGAFISSTYYGEKLPDWAAVGAAVVVRETIGVVLVTVPVTVKLPVTVALPATVAIDLIE